MSVKDETIPELRLVKFLIWRQLTFLREKIKANSIYLYFSNIKLTSADVYFVCSRSKERKI